jgi:chorismate dehydratase
MDLVRLSASSYSNTAPLVWSFLYGSGRGKAELILDNAPARSAELFAADRVDAALVPVIASQMLDGVRLVPGVCVGAKERVQSVCIVTRGADLTDVRSIALDVSSRTSVALTKVIFREFLPREPDYLDAAPDIEAMIKTADAALLIGDPALAISSRSAPESTLRVFDLAETWRSFTGLGFIFAMWMTRKASVPVDLAAARDEGLRHLADIARNYSAEIGMASDAMVSYLSESISYTPDDAMLRGMDLFFDLAYKHGFTPVRRHLEFVDG